MINRACSWPVGLSAIMLLVSVLLGSFSIFRYPINHDVSWLLYLSSRVVDGAKLYVDYPEINPPLIVWFGMPMAIAANLIGASVETIFRLFVLALALISVSCSVLLLRNKLGTNAEWALLSFVLYAVITLPGYDFGQREHLALLLALPYLAESVLRMQGNTRIGFAHVGAAALASAGFALKPHFLLVPLLVEAVLVLKTRRPPAPGPFLIGGAMLLYFAAICIVTPGYFPMLRMLTRAYWIYTNANWLDILLSHYCLGAIILGGFAWIVRPEPRNAFCIISAASIAFALSALVQRNGWSYHWYPSAAGCWLLFALAMVATVSKRRIFNTGAAQLVVGLVSMLMSALAFAIAPHAAQALNPYPAQLEPIIRQLGGGPVMVLASPIPVSFPLVTRPGIGTSSRFPTMGMVAAAFMTRDHDLDRYMHETFAADMRTTPPRLLVVEQRPDGLPEKFDYLEYFAQDPVVADELANFEMSGQVGKFKIFKRIRPPAEPG